LLGTVSDKDLALAAEQCFAGELYRLGAGARRRTRGTRNFR